MNKLISFFRDYSVARFFIPAGLILVIVSGIVFVIVGNTQDYKKTEAEVTKIELVEEAYTDENGNQVEARYDVYVKYTVDGKEYNEYYGEFNSAYKKGQKVTIAYNPKDPKQITQPNGFLLPIIILALGGGFLAIGIVSLVKNYKRRKAMKLQEMEWANNG